MPFHRERERQCQRRSLLRRTAVLATGWLMLGVPAAAQTPADPVRVFFPGTGCSTPLLEVEVFSREDLIWDAHPVHPVILADSCQMEDAGYLLNEIRVRCLATEETSATWRVGVPVFSPGVVDGCLLPNDRAPRVRITRPLPGSLLRPEKAVLRIEGRVHFGVPESRSAGGVDASLLEGLVARMRRSLPGVDEVRVENASTGETAREVSVRPDGRFTASLPVRDGPNRVRATARATNARSGSTEIDIEVEEDRRQRLLEAERQRMDRVRQGKRVEIEPDTEP